MRTVFILCSYRRARAFDRRGGPRLGWCKAARASDLGRQVQRHGGCGVARLLRESPGRSEIARPLALHGRTCRCGSPRALHAVRHVSVACCARLPWRLIDSSTIAACFFSKLALNIWPHRATCTVHTTCTVQHATCTVLRCVAPCDMHRATCDMHRAALHCTPQHAPCSAASAVRRRHLAELLLRLLEELLVLPVRCLPNRAHSV